MLLCFERRTCLNGGYPVYDTKYCRAILSYVKISELSQSPCDKDHFLAFATNGTEQEKLLQVIYGRNNSQILIFGLKFDSFWSKILVMLFYL